MNNYKDLNSLSDNIMIKKLQERMYSEKEDDKGGREEKEICSGVIECVFCGSKVNLHRYMGDYYCSECFRELMKLSRNKL